MPRKPNLLNVREHLEWEVELIGYVLKEIEDQKHPVPPLYTDELNKLRFIAKAILRKHAKRNNETNQRKDIYVEAGA